MGPEPTLREAREDDVSELATLYADSVRRLGRGHYDSDALEAWASFGRRDRFHDFVLDNHTLVAEVDDEIAGFAGMDESGRIVSLYVHPGRSRQGIGSVLLAALLELGREAGVDRFRAEASELSKPLFERFGFSVVGTEVVEREGVGIERYRMARGATGRSEEP